MQQQQHQEQQHPFAYIFLGRLTWYLLSIVDVVQLRATCTWLRGLFGAPQLRDRLRHSVGSQAGPRRAVNGQQVQLLRFDDDQFGVRDLLAAVCVMEEGSWVEIGVVIELAGQCGYCELPVILTSDDINTHANKTAYMSAPRVFAQLMVVGRHVKFSDNSCLQIFRHANGEVRAIKDEPGFQLDIDPPLLVGHLYQRNRLEHDPPVRSGINYNGGRWVSSFIPFEYPSMSSFAKRVILRHFPQTHQINSTLTTLHRRVGGGRLDGLLTQSPHTPVAGCTITFSRDGRVRWLVLTNSSHTFVAWILIEDQTDNAWVDVVTTEVPLAGVSENAPFKDRFLVTTQLARVALGAVAPYVFDGQVQQQQQDDDSDDDGHGGGWDDMDDDSEGEDSGGEDAAAEEESGD
ncbi:unnamed protein product [Vitrella brassicaformis CCMP3155]|uniref:Uncharacterized protein n=1 Tax=Vitrella brassicaformis (strain CCMP3155) TaxID=1169540 RepID=A0A0G4F8Y4_VITBC|nr:unnamed protein product [Vitrella brassicaformis CCMP3155]|eukprot:CEM09039.1 unnamed protein product [Vitrella brassicaformis CCMP3155]